MKRVLSMLLGMMLCLSSLPAEAFAANGGAAAWYGVDIDVGNLNLSTYETTVAYAGYEWWVIGGGDAEGTSMGVNPGGEGTVTLFLKSRIPEEVGRPMPFRSALSVDAYRRLPENEKNSYQYYEGTHKNSGDGYTQRAYYTKNILPGLNEWTRPNEYAGSTVQQAVEAATDEIPEKERTYIVSRDFEGSDLPGEVSRDGIAGQDLQDQHLWLLSEDEWEKIASEQSYVVNVLCLQYGSDWWLRSPGSTDYCKNECGFHAALISRDGRKQVDLADEAYLVDARPALILRLPSSQEILMMTETGFSESWGGLPEGKDAAKLGGGFIPLARPNTTGENQRLKFTVLDDAQKLTLSAPANMLTEHGRLLFSYAFTHQTPKAITSGKYYISCMIRDQAGALMGYARLAEPGQGVEGKGDVAIDLQQIQEAGIDLKSGSSYSFFFFTEEVNGALYTDFASPPVEVKITVGADGAFTVDRSAVNTHAAAESSSTEYDKANPTNLPSVLLDLGGNELVDVLRDEEPLKEGKDYTIADAESAQSPAATQSLRTARQGAYATKSIVFTADYLGGLSHGQHTFTFVMSCGPDPDATILIRDTRPSDKPSYSIKVAVSPENGGYAYADKTSAMENATVALTASPASGFQFKEWKIDPNSVSIIENCFTMPAKDVAVTAVFEEIKTIPTPPTDSGEDDANEATYYTLVFETNGGNEIAKVRGGYGTTIDLTKYTPTREGYKFTGWYADKELASRINSVRLDRNQIVYAGWMNSNSGSYEGCDRGKNCPAYRFTDLNLSLWYHDGIHYCVERDLMVGYPNGCFGPNDTLTRSAFAVILWRIEGHPVVDYTMDFSDVDPAAWYGEAVRWAASKGIMNGYGNGKIGPNDPITREQFATMLYNYEKQQGGDFTSAWAFRLDFDDANSVSEWAYEPMRWCVMNGVISGVGDKQLAPQDEATRSQAATMLMRYME